MAAASLPTHDTSPTLPKRVHNAPEVFARYPHLAPQLLQALRRADPRADLVVAINPSKADLDRALRGELWGAPDPLRRFVEEAAELPDWVDFDRSDAAGELLFRSGPAGGICLGAKSLIGGYCSPAGNKPLAFSGRLEDSVSRRVGETARFVTLTCTPGSLRPFAEGWQVTLRVRLMHARVRQLLLRSNRWNPDWGLPINQHDMAATTLLFSQVFLDGLEAFGEHISSEEAEAYLHLWRISGWLMGVEDALLATNTHQAQAMLDIIERTQGEPDEDSRRLTAALLNSPPPWPVLQQLQLDLSHGFCRHLVGEERADQLQVDRTRWSEFIPKFRRLRHIAQRLPDPTRRLRHRYAVAQGRRYWNKHIEDGTGTLTPDFPLPQLLRHLAA